MAGSSSPTVRRRRLAAALREARRSVGLTTAELAAGCDVSQSTISRIENAEVTAQPNHVRAIAVRLGLGEQRTGELVELARQLRLKGWWDEFGDTLADRYATFIELESAATTVRTYEPSVLPGLLQTPDYARAVTTARPLDDPGALDDLVAVRTRRQHLLTRPDNPLHLHAVIDETALRRPYGRPHVMTEQLHHLAELAALPNITVQTLPIDTPDQPAYTGPFALLTFPDPEPPVVFCEGMRNDAYLENPDDITWFTHIFTHLTTLAHTPHHTSTARTGQRDAG